MLSSRIPPRAALSGDPDIKENIFKYNTPLKQNRMWIPMI